MRQENFPEWGSFLVCDKMIRMPDETTQPQVVAEPTVPEPQQPTLAPTATQSPTEPTTDELGNLEKSLEALPVAPEAPTSPTTREAGQTLESPVLAPETPATPQVPASA